LIVHRGCADGFADLRVQVEQLHRYVCDEDEWFELVGPSNEGRVSVEWELDEGELSIVLVREAAELGLEGLGLSEEDLVALDEGHPDAPRQVTVDGDAFRFEESHETGFAEHGGEPNDGFYLWSFEGVDGESCLSVEKWEGEEFRAYLGEYYDPQEVRVQRS
jgi:hypothetical protein